MILYCVVCMSLFSDGALLYDSGWPLACALPGLGLLSDGVIGTDHHAPLTEGFQTSGTQGVICHPHQCTIQSVVVTASPALLPRGGRNCGSPVEWPLLICIAFPPTPYPHPPHSNSLGSSKALGPAQLAVQVSALLTT